MGRADCEPIYVKTRFKRFKSKRRKFKIMIAMAIIFCFIFLIFSYLNKVVNPIIYAYSKSEVEKLISVSAYNSIKLNINSIDYDQLININYDNNNNIKSISANSFLINKIGNLLTIETQKQFEKKSKLGVSIPLGTCSGLVFLAGKGSNIHLTLNPIGNVSCDFFSLFSQAGINQTLHKIIVKLQCEVSVILPFFTRQINQEVEFLISECVIIGNVPSTYINIGMQKIN